jgi:acetyl esterase/lipase
MIVHGGFWRPGIDRSHTGPMSAALAGAGWTVASIEYRRIPGQPDVTCADIARALQRVPGMVGDHDGRVLLVGHSAGGHLVLWAAVRAAARLAGVLALAPAADLRVAHERNLGDGAAAAFLGAYPESRSDLDPRQMISPGISVTIVHGVDDAIVPIALSEGYAEAHPRTRLRCLSGAGHFALIDPLHEAWLAVTEELARLAVPPGTR